ncbi:DUF3592 domain-containing protein [Affinibrenneria salicis]|uniref:DUF3592 domain-containing protein n=1 Tax=Affinibrenneria salicis TaxID=2590031 RepID=A0A5J5G7R7_9GAMM|nr:DUF3592 domain-containing protein [Affinibrenneria salicis]KAA9002628.1 DUF3592 domain-containing protein [Affinibrenneria salicis]KAA9003084.1 DUF3592 domain-containing protein [Affinibrenneria salicis]
MKRLKVIITILIFIPLIPFISLFGFFKFIVVDVFGYVKTVIKNVNILRDGIPTNGEIVSISQEGLRDADNPVCKIRVLFIDGDGNEKEVDTISAINIVDIPNYQKGSFIMIKYDPKDSNKIAIDN